MIKQIQPTHADELLAAANSLLGAQGDTKSMRKQLRVMMDIFFLHEGSINDLEGFYCTYQEVDRLLKKIGNMADTYTCDSEKQ